MRPLQLFYMNNYQWALLSISALYLINHPGSQYFYTSDINNETLIIIPHE